MHNYCIRVKCVLRFAYTSVQGGTTDPIKSVLLNHIAQLKDIPTENQDAILAVQAGFVGPWGEWHGSTNFDDDLEGRRAIVDALLGAVPDRSVQVRTPRHKRTLYASAIERALASDGHVRDGGFEEAGDGWEGYVPAGTSPGTHGYAVDSDAYGGSHSARVVNGWARQWMPLNVTGGNEIVISGWSRRVNGEFSFA